MTNTFEMQQIEIDERVSQAYTFENVSKYEEVLSELKYVLLEQRVKKINEFADQYLNDEMKIKDIPMRERYFSY